MTITDPVIKARWFDLPRHRGLAQIVGFDSSPGPEAGTGAPELSVEEHALLRDLASRARSGSNDLEGPLAKLGVGSESEAIEYAIKAGVTWR